MTRPIKSSRRRAGESVSSGMALGVALGAAFDHVGIGPALGVAFGVALDKVRSGNDTEQEA